MASFTHSDLKFSFAFLSNLTCLLVSALLAQYLSQSPLLMFGCLVSLFFGSMLLGWWGWAILTMMAGLFLSAESTVALTTFFSFSLSCLLIQFLGEKEEKIEKEEDPFHAQLCVELKQAVSDQIIIESEEVRLRELRKQFEEKSHNLHETRKQLFLLEGHLHSKKLQHEEKLFAPDTLLDAWQGDLQTLLEENASLKKENEQLEEIVSHSQPKAPRFSKPSIYTGADLFSLPTYEKSNRN